MSIEECLEMEEGCKKNNKFKETFKDGNCYTDETDLPLIGSCEHAISLASQWTGGIDTHFLDVTETLVWRLSPEVKAATGPAFSTEDS